MSVVDTLITVFKGDSTDYNRATDSMDRSNRELEGSMMRATRLARSMGSAIGTALGVAVSSLATASAAVTSFSVYQAASMDILERQLTVITGSAARAAEVVKFAQELAGPSAFFDTKQLAEAARILESMRLSTETFLPIASTMASLFGQDAQALNEFSMALGRLKAGNFGESFERFREFGISSQDLEAQGLSFKSGQFQLFDEETTAQAADRALQAVVNIVRSRFGELDAMMQDSPMAKFTSVMDALGRMSLKVGTTLLNALKGPLTDISDALTNLANSPWPDIIGRKLAGAFNLNNAASLFKEGLASMLAALMQVPEVASTIGKDLGDAWKVAREAMAVYLSVQAGLLAAETVRGIQAAVAAIQALGTATKASAVAMAILSGLQKNWKGIAAGLLAGLGVYAFLTSTIDNGLNLDPSVVGFDQQKFEMERDAIKNAMSGSDGGPSIEEAIQEAINALENSQPPGDAGAKPPGGAGDSNSPQVRILQAIEKNTRPEFGGAEAFGGGRLGALGVTPVELAGIGRRGGSRFAAQLADLIGNEMARQVDQRVADMMRYGALRTS